MPNELLTCTILLSIIARKLGHDYVLLTSGFWPGGEKWCRAIFGHYDSYGTELLEADGKPVLIKSVDAECHFRSNEDMYSELVELMYKTLESGGKLSDGKSEVDASDVPEFMVECSLLGL